MNDWNAVEFKGIALGDKRLDRRAVRILGVFGSQYERSIPQAFQSRAEAQACYRFFDSDLVDQHKLLDPHYKATLERIQQHPIVLIPSDTTSLNFTKRKALTDSGYISSNNAQGFFLHASIAITPERLSLGVVGNILWAREKEKAKQLHRDLRSIDEKENRRWLESYLNAGRIAQACPNTQIVNIVDREGDFYELLFESQKEQQMERPSAHIIIRSRFDRVLLNAEGKSSRLLATLKDSPELGRASFDLIGRDSDAGRNVTQAYRAQKIVIRGKDKVGVDCKEITINAVLLEEVDCPEGAEPVSWLLLTTLPIGTLEDVQKIILYYLCRWEIEVFFKTFKSGCKVEEKQLRSSERLFSLFTVFLIVAWRVHYLMNLSRVYPETPCTLVFDDAEWKSAYVMAKRKLELPEVPPTLDKMMRLVAQLGGYLNRKNDPPPGAKAIWKGLTSVTHYADAWEAFGPGSKVQPDFIVKKTYA